ncbi:MAG: iron-sulfur cluster repair di-iron protein [Ramlibacter sp.]|nr:iron-sulfur cluster repair di-iron protein [Ramlibacter sp.]
MATIFFRKLLIHINSLVARDSHDQPVEATPEPHMNTNSPRGTSAADASGERHWANASAPELVEYILARYHAVHRELLPELIRLARKVEQVHADSADCPHGLADHLSGMAQGLESHMRKEEDVLFPMLASGQGALAGAPITVMRMEHDEHEAALRRLAGMTDDLRPPPVACATWRALYAGLQTFRRDLLAHIQTENEILFQRFAPAAVN